MESNKPRRFYLITVPRVASNLLVRMLALDKQPNVLTNGPGAGYFFLPAWRGVNRLKMLGRPIEQWTAADRAEMKNILQTCFDALQNDVERAEAEGKILFVKEHACFMTEPTAWLRFRLGSDDGVPEPRWQVQVPDSYAAGPTQSSLNNTVLPDAFLRTWRPTFLIRHPALVFPSRYRAYVDINAQRTEEDKLDEGGLEVNMTYRWIKGLFDLWTQLDQQQQRESPTRAPGAATHDNGDDIAWPLVIDADDLMTDPTLIVRFSDILGLDRTKLQSEWAPATAEDLAKLPDDEVRRMLSTLSASGGVVQGKTAAGLDLVAERRKWREEFGEEMGANMERWVDRAMPDYEAMRARRLRTAVAGG